MAVDEVIAAPRVREARSVVIPFWMWLGWLVLLMVGCGAVSVLHGTDAMWDTKNYHLYNPFAAFHDRYAYDVAPAQQQSYLNPILDYPFYFAVRLLNDYPRVIAFLLGLPQGVNLWVIGLLAWRISDAWSRAARIGLALVATWIGATGAGTLPLVGSPTGDVVVSIPVLGAFLMMMRTVDLCPRSSSLARRNAVVCGLLAGVAVGAKPTMACYAVGFGAALLFAVPWRTLPSILLSYAAAGITGAATTGGYHALRLLRLFGNPLFPLANNLFHSRFWEGAALRDTRFLPKTALEALKFPFAWAASVDHRLVAELGFRDIRVALGLSALALACVAALLTRVRGGGSPPRSILALFTSCAVSYVLWLVVFSIYRYLLPIEMLSGVLLLAALSQLALPSAIPVLMAAAAGAAWITTVPLEWGHMPFGKYYVEVSAPRIQPDTLVLVVGSDPVAFLIPFLDPQVRWISLDNNLLRPEQGNALVARERGLIEMQTGPMMVLDAGAPSAEVETILAAYGLVENADRCGHISSNLGGETYTLCTVSQREP